MDKKFNLNILCPSLLNLSHVSVARPVRITIPGTIKSCINNVNIVNSVISSIKIPIPIRFCAITWQASEGPMERCYRTTGLQQVRCGDRHIHCHI